MITLKLLTATLALIIAWEMTLIWRLGRQLAQQPDSSTFKYILARHKSLLKCIGWLTVLAVVLVEVQVRLSPAPYEVAPALFIFHLVAVVMLATVAAMIVFWLTGLRSSYWHRRLVYAFFGLYALVAATGSIMLYQLPTAG